MVCVWKATTAIERCALKKKYYNTYRT